MDTAQTAKIDWKRSYYAETDQSDALRKECDSLRKDAERYRKLCDVPGALDAFTAAYHNTQTKARIDAAVDGRWVLHNVEAKRGGTYS